MAILVIGSKALNFWSYRHIPLLKHRRKPRDLDIIARFDESMDYLKALGCDAIYPIKDGKKIIGKRKAPQTIVEAEIAWPNSTALSLLEEMECSFPGNLIYAPLDVLYTLKMSHRYLRNSPHFLKTMRDIRLMREVGAEIPEYLKEWFKVREAETYDYKHPNLSQNKANFFDTKGVDYIYDHDSLHEAIKLASRPAYMEFKPAANEVYCSKDMFFACPLQTRINAVYEESAVLALERSLIPHPGALTPESAFCKALQKVSSSITSGWFREFAWENHDRTLDLYHSLSRGSQHYVKLFELGLTNGTIKPFVSGK